MKSRFLLAAVIAFSALSLPAQTPTDIPPRQKAPNDESAYRRFTLDNGLKVILLSDPKLNKSSAALAVGVGSLTDPKDRRGLAHFLEHMLFLGTEKYPDESDYGNYLKTNGGYNNAYTGGDHTNYHFEIRHEAFEGALDRMAQFFIAPLFTPEFTDREMNAVNSEYQKNLENDGWREFQLHCSLYRADHPANQFNIGNRDTLTGTTREELLAFHQAHYSANTMTLAIVGKDSLDQLESWVRTYYSGIKNKHLEPIRFDPDFSPAKPALRLLRMEPVKDLRQMSLEFALPATLQFYDSKPSRLIGFILGHEGEGSLLSQLKAEGLATGLSAGANSQTPDYGTFDATVNLTTAGLANYHRVLELFYSAVARLKSSGYPDYLFNEQQAMARLDEAFKDKGEGAGRAVELANLIRDYPFEFAEREPYLWLQPDPKAYQVVLNQLRPDNMLVTLIAKGIETDQVEHYYGTKYSYHEDAGEAYTSLLGVKAIDAIQLPKPNPFVPAQATMLPIQPVQLIDEPGLSLYYAQDTEFLRPMVTEIYRFRLPRSLGTLENSVLLSFYAACVNEALNENAYPAKEAGLDFSITAALEGVQVVVSGYDASATRLLDVIAGNLVGFELSEERFQALKDRVLRGLRNFPLSDAYQILNETRRSSVREFHFRQDEQLPVAESVTLAAVHDFAGRLYAQGKIEAMVHGNVSAAAAMADARRISAVIANQGVADHELLRRKLLAQPKGETLRSSEKLEVNNSAFRREYILGDDAPEIRATTLVLSNFMGEPFYSEMRTRQQLGYIVWGGAGDEEHSNFAYFIIQSGDYPADEVEARADKMINELPGLLANLSDEAWATIIDGVRSQLEEKDKAIADRTARLFGLGYDDNADWDRRVATIAALEKLTKAGVVDFLKTAIAPETRMMRTYLGFSREHEPKTPQENTFTDRAEWKKTRSYQ